MRRAVGIVSVVWGLATLGCGGSEPQFQGASAAADEAAGHCEPETVAEGRTE